MICIRKLLYRLFPAEEIGWKEIGEEFTRWTVAKTRWFRIYIHRLDAKQLHPQCHDHPWHFWAFIPAGGYYEHTDKGVCWRGPGSLLYRPATYTHNVVTPTISWSVIVTSGKMRRWGFLDCGQNKKK